MPIVLPITLEMIHLICGKKYTLSHNKYLIVNHVFPVLLIFWLNLPIGCLLLDIQIFTMPKHISFLHQSYENGFKLTLRVH